jgi:hypothetical protein
MSDIERKRVIMLAVSGLLLGATIFGWARYINSTSGGRDSSNAGLASQPSESAAGSRSVPNNAPTTVAVQPSSEAAADMVPASKPVEVGLVARHSAGRESPMAALDYGSGYPPGRYRRYPEQVDGRAYRQAGVDVPLPPPPDPSVSNGGEARPYNPPQRPLPVLKDAIRLVGVIDGKAIFTVPSDVAAENGVTPSFTLGQGQKYAGITVQEIKTHSVTVSDGKSICTKELSTLN